MLVTLDYKPYEAKPRNFGALTNRFKTAGATEIDEASFCQHVRSGRSWVGGVYRNGGADWGEFVGQQLFGIDFDNDKDVVGPNGKKTKRPLSPGEKGFIDPLDALKRCSTLKIAPLCLYFTLSAKLEPLHYKFRVVFDMGEVVKDQMTAEGIIATLLEKFPEADQKCRNTNRLFCGSCGEVWETWKAWS